MPNNDGSMPETEQEFDDISPDDIALAAMQGLLAKPDMLPEAAAVTAWSVVVPAYYKGREMFLRIQAGAAHMAEWVKNNPGHITGGKPETTDSSKK